MGCLQGSTGHLVGGHLGGGAGIGPSTSGSVGSVGMLSGNIDTGDYDVPHPHPYTHHYMQTSSITPPHSTMSLIGSRPGSAGAGICPGHDSGSDSSQGCGSVMGGVGGAGVGVGVGGGGGGSHMTAHLGGGHHSGGSGSLGRCSSRCHNTNTTTTDDSGGGSGGSGFGGGGSCGGGGGGGGGVIEMHHRVGLHGSAGSGLNGCGVGVGGPCGRTSALGTIHNGHHHQYHHECIHYERLPIPVPIPTVPTVLQQQLHSEEEIEPAYATGM